ncbi:unnamed protein product [Cladocopium goreaui]|uniref:Uncharacterized protein n=1 Tax=Cladocopium goreaui TaxID=2562237 RepID=A0A9P1DSE4_9DINO|nr:unnamed protein product [Cladocopium goreaui]
MILTYFDALPRRSAKLVTMGYTMVTNQVLRRCIGKQRDPRKVEIRRRLNGKQSILPKWKDTKAVTGSTVAKPGDERSLAPNRLPCASSALMTSSSTISDSFPEMAAGGSAPVKRSRQEEDELQELELLRALLAGGCKDVEDKGDKGLSSALDQQLDRVQMPPPTMLPPKRRKL